MPKQNENLQLGCFEIDCADDELTAQIDGLYNPDYDWNGWKSPYAWYSDIQAFCDAMGWTLDIDKDGDILTITFPDGTTFDAHRESITCMGVFTYHHMYNLEGLVWRVVS